MKKLLGLSLLFAMAGFGQSVPLPQDVDKAIASTVDFEGTVTQGVTDLVTKVTPSIMPFAWDLLALFGVYALLRTLLQSTKVAVSYHHFLPLSMVADYVAILFRIVAATVMLSYYTTPIPGVSFNFHQMFPTLGNVLSQTITTDMLKEVLGHFSDAISFLPSFGILEVGPALLTLLVLILISLAQIGMTIITAGSYAIIGVLTLCGPLMIPFYVLPGHEKKFWSWFDNMLVYSMYGFIGSCFIYVFCFAYLDFFTNQHGFGVGQWLVSLPMMLLITIVFLYTMFKVPEIAHLIFGGVGGIAQGFASTLQSLAVKGVLSFV